MKYKVSELRGAPLDAAVAKAEGTSLPHGSPRAYRPSMNWRQGGPIIEREAISLACSADRKVWYALPPETGADRSGPTPLVAAMRAYVASKLGEEIDL